MSTGENGEETPEIDPRVELSEALHEFFIEAVVGQRDADGRREASGRERRPAGSRYKVESGFLKVHLQPPAPDVLVGVLDSGSALTQQGPNIWLLLPLVSDGVEEVIDEILAAETILMHILPLDPTVPPVTYLVENDHFSLLDFEENAQIPPPPAAHLTVVEAEVDHAEKEREEQGLARLWTERLRDYELRSITTTSTTAA